MDGPYRATAPKLRGDAPDRLECWLRDGDRGRWIRAAFVKLWLGGIGAFTASQWGLGALAALPLLIGLAWASLDFRRRKGDAAVLSVDAGRLSIAGPALTTTCELDALEDVRLDTKATSKNLTVARADGVNTIFGAASNHDIALDVARIELVFEDGARPLSKERISHSLCLDTLREIRLFLRAHGWRPADERLTEARPT